MSGEGRHPDRIPAREAGVSLPASALGGTSRTLDPPVAVRAWVYTRARGWLRVVGDAVAWTPKAGMVRYRDEQGRTDAVWVWAAAIERRDEGLPRLDSNQQPAD